MITQFLYYIHYAILLIFGVAVSAIFSGIDLKKNLLRLLFLALLCGGLQIATYCTLGEMAVWYWYPVITHLPIVLALHFLFDRPILNTVSATASAYLCCQPAKWFGLATFAVTQNSRIEFLVRILILSITVFVLLQWFADKFAKLYSPHNKGSWVFGITPVVYYLFDYAVAIYSNLWANNHQLVVEFLPFFLCIGHLLFCTVYYREYGLRNEVERKEQILRITVEQQTKELEVIRRSETEIRRLRHDMRLFLNSLSSCIEQSDKETALKLISGFSKQAVASSLKHYCSNDTLNYVLSDYAAQCREKDVPFHSVIELAELPVDEIHFSTILINALDNALNAQKYLPADKRGIRLMLKNNGEKTLLCVKNRFYKPPQFRDGLPVTSRNGHGHGVISIQYATEKLGGNCQFTLEENWFILRVVV